MKINEYLQLKETYEKRKIREAKIQGELDSLFKQAKDKYDVGNLEELEKRITKLNNLIEDKTIKFNKEVEKLEEEINAQES